MTQLDFSQDLNLEGIQWDACVIGNGVAALWTAHQLWASQKSVLWISGEEPYSAPRAALQHAWFWGVSQEDAAVLTENLKGITPTEAPLEPFGAVYFEAKGSKRFRPFSEVSPEWGNHEVRYFEAFARSVLALEKTVSYDLWGWHSKLAAFYDLGEFRPLSQVELFKEPRFVRVQSWPIAEIRVDSSSEKPRVTEVHLESKVEGKSRKRSPEDKKIVLAASEFFFADFDESLASFIKVPALADELSSINKGKTFLSGFGLRLWHQEFSAAVMGQTLVVPLTVSPEKGAATHVMGRFFQGSGGIESEWVGFLTDSELEDNNEILKKIKQTKRALERAMPGFENSVLREAVSFEPKMAATSLLKRRKREVLGAKVLTDHLGIEVALNGLRNVLGLPILDLSKTNEGAEVHETGEDTHLRRVNTKKRRPARNPDGVGPQTT